MSILLLLAFAIVILLIVAVIGFVVIRLRRDRLDSKERMLNKLTPLRIVASVEASSGRFHPHLSV